MPGPGQARELLREELARGQYHRSLLERLREWLGELLDRAASGAGRFSELGLPVLIVVAVVLVAGLALVLSRLRRNPAAATPAGAVFAVRLSAGEHRALAQAALGAGDFDTAVVETMRALAAGLVERGVVPDVSAATAAELVAQAQPRFPELAERLGTAAAVFDRTRYGGRHATANEAQELLALEQSLAGAPAGAR